MKKERTKITKKAPKAPEPDAREVLLGAKGRLVVPAPIRRALGLKQGERMVFLIGKDGRIGLKTVADAVSDARGMYKHLAPLSEGD